MEATANSNSSVKLIVGIFFTLLGILMTAENLGAEAAHQYLRYWPLVIIAVGVMKVIEPSSRVAGSLLMLLGLWVLARTTGLIRFSLFDLWPVILIGAGLVMVARGIGYSPSMKLGDGKYLWSVLNNRRIANASTDFRGVNVASVLGGCVIDLTEADITNGPAVIEVMAVMGGIEILVPPTWEVTGEVMPLMAGFGMKSANPRDPQRRLIVRGFAMMAGVEVKGRRA